MVFVDGTDAGLELIKEGFAWAYAKYLPEASLETQQSYTAAQAAAQAARIGLWGMALTTSANDRYSRSSKRINSFRPRSIFGG